MMEHSEADRAEGQDGSIPWWVTLIDALLIVNVAALLTYTYAFQPVVALQYGVGGLLLCTVLWYGLRYRRRGRAMLATTESSAMSRIILLDEEGEHMKEWYVQGETSLLIGKSSPQMEVDIDLSDAEYAVLVSPQHAVLNYADGKWYVEDADSRNGIGIRQANASSVQRVDTEKPQEIGSGDMLYIANTRLLLK